MFTEKKVFCMPDLEAYRSAGLIPGLAPRNHDASRDHVRAFNEAGAITGEQDSWKPDHWTQHFVEGLTHKNLSSLGIQLEGSIVCEVGVGTAYVPCRLYELGFKFQEFIGIDISEASVRDAKVTLSEKGINAQVFHSDGLGNIPESHRYKMNNVIACVPQVCLPNDVDISQGSNFGNYYIPDGSSLWDDQGLGLISRVIKQTPDHASVTLNLAGRPGVETLMNVFSDAGRTPSIIHHKIISQAQDTRLDFFVEQEKKGLMSCVFYADPYGKNKLTAVRAEQVQAEGAVIYHDLLVIAAPSLKNGC
ncbi:MAG: hypothetical protein J0L77_01165 [Alphaproteobacteria bacterium]|nr:hypothetical protein [Alphaproteobacteria bacterium]